MNHSDLAWGFDLWHHRHSSDTWFYNVFIISEEFAACSISFTFWYVYAQTLWEPDTTTGIPHLVGAEKSKSWNSETLI